jgi:hypothetical protein
MKKLIAYSSVTQMGFVVMGPFALTAQGVGGASSTSATQLSPGRCPTSGNPVQITGTTS